MIVYSDSFIDGWNRKIIYAPNGFGKTTSAKQIALNLQKKNIRVGLFTRREIEELVQDFDDKLYMGIDAKTLVEKMRIEEAYSKADPLKKYAKQHCSASTVSAAKKTSFYFNYCGIKNFSDIPSLPAKPNKGLAFPFAKEDGELFSTLIDYSIFKQCEEIVEKKAFLKNKKVLKQNQKDANSQIPSQYLECLYHLYFYVKLNHLSRCVLCGKAYRGNASLVAHIEEQIKLLKPIDSPDCLDQVRRCAEQILSSIKSKSNNSFSALFSGIKTNTTIQQYNLIRTYYELGKCVGDSVQSSVDAITIDEKGTTIADARKKLTECDEKIQATKKEKATIKRFNNYIEKQISEILHFNDNVRFQPLDDECGFSFTLGGKKISHLYEILSESEIKRIALIVLRAEIKYSHIQSLILDDPIDSYDDYYKAVSADYIGKMLKTKRLVSWYITTNDFEAVFLLSHSTKAPTIFYLEDLDTVFGLPEKPFIQECSSDEVIKKIALNEISVLADFVTMRQSKFVFDQDILLCSLSLTLRNIKTEIIHKYPNLHVCLPGAGPSFSEDSSWESDVFQRIESQSEHFVPSHLPGSSCSLTVGDVGSCFARLSNSKKSYPASFAKRSDSYETFRENVAKKPFVCTKTYVDVINYLYKKILLINYIKYEFEKRIINLLSPIFSSTELASVLNAPGLGNKIREAELINNTSGHGLGAKLAHIQNVFNANSVVFNAFDHALTLLVTPYLSTSVRDIERFYVQVCSI